MSKSLLFFICLAGLSAAASAAEAQTPQCSLENIASPEEIKAGWTLVPERKTVEQTDSAPFQEGAKGNWFITRISTRIPNCSAYDDMGNYSLRSYMLPKITSTEKIQICQATTDGGSILSPPPPGTKAQPANTATLIYDAFDRPYAGSCPPAMK